MTKLYSAETLLIEGPDAIAFAHAQFSSNVTALAVGRWQFSAWLDPQGRVRALFHLARLADDRLLILLRGGESVTIVDALKRFIFRSKVTLTALAPCSLATGPALPLSEVLQNDQKNLLLGCDTHSLRISAESMGDSAWRLAQLRRGWPWLPPSISNELLGPALSLHRLHAVEIDKGCYPGQEIVARLHYRGGNKKHLHRIAVSSAENSLPCVAGDILRVATNEKILLLDVIQQDASAEALAVINYDIAAGCIDGTIACSDDRISVRILETWSA
ncbi:CAF17-like 4Fe-4S cluster assembly/insertion protein YgfZ [Rhodanobacter sp. BL-MT-08]